MIRQDLLNVSLRNEHVYLFSFSQTRFTLKPAIWCFKKVQYFHTVAAKMVGRTWKAARHWQGWPAFGRKELFVSPMIDWLCLQTQGCSALQSATDGNNTPFPLSSHRSVKPVHVDKSASLWTLHGHIMTLGLGNKAGNVTGMCSFWYLCVNINTKWQNKTGWIYGSLQRTIAS